jgi:hypothetical protein
MSPQILYIIITSFIGAFKEYTAVVGLFNGPGTVKGDYSMETIVYYIYDNLSSHTAWAAAGAVFLFVIILIFTFLQLQMGLEETGPLLRRKKRMSTKKLRQFPQNPVGGYHPFDQRIRTDRRNDSPPRKSRPNPLDDFDVSHHWLSWLFW